MCGLVELPDPCDTSDEPSWGLDLVLGVAGGFVDKYRLEGGISGKTKRAAAHGGVLG